MKKEKPFFTKSKDSFTFSETYCLRQYQIGMIKELENMKYKDKQKAFFMSEIQGIERFIKAIDKYA